MMEMSRSVLMFACSLNEASTPIVMAFPSPGSLWDPPLGSSYIKPNLKHMFSRLLTYTDQPGVDLKMG